MKKNIQKGTKGITLIALVITIIVLLILAGVTISQLTGSDSAPAKANEAAQKNAIGEAKDDVQLTAINAQTKGYDTAYVQNGTPTGSSKIVVGTEVIKAVAQKYQTNNKVGKATVEVTGYGTIENVTGNATVSIYTTDFIVEGTILREGGQLTWGEIDENKPGIRFDLSSPIEVEEGAEQDITAILKQIPANTTVEWTSSDTAGTYVTVIPKTDSKQATIEGIAKTSTNVTITASAGGYSATIEVKVTEEQLDKVSDKRQETVNASSFTAVSTEGSKTLKDEVGNRVKVPQNFRIAAASGDYVQDGIVIEDSNLNQFVWVPVGTIKKATNKTTNPITTTDVTITLGRYSNFTASNGTYTTVQAQNASNKDYTPTASNQVALNTNYYEFKDDAESTAVKNKTYGNTKAKELDKFVKSTLTNGGYYIARYEAGIEGTTASTKNGQYSINNTTFYTDGTSTNKISDNVNEYVSKLTSKSGKGVWNKINQPNAATLCQNMYSSGVNSDLVNSYAWDTAIIFIQQCGNNSSYYNTSGQSTDTSKPAATGVNTLNATKEVDVQCNIYDMAGNVSEWTTETNTSNPCVWRGGSSNGNNTTSYHYGLSTTLTDDFIGFRPLLYL